MKWYETTAKALLTGKAYTHAELIALLKENYPYVSSNSYQWALQDMLKSNRIIKTGYNQYQVPEEETRIGYSPCYSELARDLIGKIERQYPEVGFVLIETSLMNEFLNTPVYKDILIVQTAKDYGMSIFRYLQEQKYPGLMYRPTRKLYDLYGTQNGIIVADLVSESPINQKKPHDVCIEKLLVDMFCDKYVGWEYDKTVYNSAFERASGRYMIDKPRFLRYANRRGKKNEITMTLPGFMGEKLIEAAKEERRNDLLNAAIEIIQSLPESQQTLYRDIRNDSLTQGQIARYYHVTPQAITNRISRLYNTICRRLKAEYGFSESEIKKIGKGTAKSFFRNV